MVATRCDFCGKPFNAEHAFSRTCYACSSQEAPDQSKLLWADYVRRARVWQAEGDEAKTEKLRRGYAAKGLADTPNLAALPSRARKARKDTRNRSRGDFGVSGAVPT